MQQQPQNHSNIILATVLSMFILLAWSFFYEQPKLHKQEMQKKASNSANSNINNNTDAKNNSPSSTSLETSEIKSINSLVARDQYFSTSEAKNKRVTINNNNLHGSILLQGAIFDDLTLANYFTQLNSKKEVVLFSPSSTTERYFADFGWINKDDSQIILPNPNTLWQANNNILTPNKPLILTWQNGQGVDFVITISIDDKRRRCLDIEQRTTVHLRQALTK